MDQAPRPSNIRGQLRGPISETSVFVAWEQVISTSIEQDSMKCMVISYKLYSPIRNEKKLLTAFLPLQFSYTGPPTDTSHFVCDDTTELVKESVK